MEIVEEITVSSAHLRCASREAALQALARMGLARNAPLAVWPPRRLPPGLYVSPVRRGWVSVWSPRQDEAEWLGPLTATLECPGVLLAVEDSRLWTAVFFQAGREVARALLPTRLVEEEELWLHTADALTPEEQEAPDAEARFQEKSREVAGLPEYREALESLRRQRPGPEVLAPFLPPHATAGRALDLLTAIDRRAQAPGEEGSDYAEDYMEAFAGYLGIRDAAWDPAADQEAFAEGDYDEEEEGLPEEWREFVVLPFTGLLVLG